MKSFFTGLAAVILIAIAVIALRGKGLIPTSDPTPTPTPSGIPTNWDMEPDTKQDDSISGSTKPTESTTPTTKGGLPITNDQKVLGATTPTTKTTTTTTTTKKVTSIKVLESSDCLLDAVTYIRDITSPLTIKYSLMDNYSATITIWKESGESVLNQTLVSGNGVLTTIDSTDNLKFQIVSQDCTETTDTWLRVTAEK